MEKKTARSSRSRWQKKVPLITLLFLICTAMIIIFSVWAPELLAKYQDQAKLNEIHQQTSDLTAAGYRYALDSSEKLYIFSEALSSHLTRNQITEQENQSVTGSYAFIVNHRGPSEKQITAEYIYQHCNTELARLKELQLLPDLIADVDEDAYTAVFYSAIDVLEPRNNVAVWKLSLSNLQKNISRQNKLIDVYLDADDGKIYEFYARTEQEWEEVNTDAMIKAWSEYLGLATPVEDQIANPLMETTPYFKKYALSGTGNEKIVVTIGFYEGINELFLKVSQ